MADAGCRLSPLPSGRARKPGASSSSTAISIKCMEPSSIESTPASPSPATSAKNWFFSLSRRKKSTSTALVASGVRDNNSSRQICTQSLTNLSNRIRLSESDGDLRNCDRTVSTDTRLTNQQQQQQFSVEELRQPTSSSVAASAVEESRNVFQRIKRKMEKKFTSHRQKKFTLPTVESIEDSSTGRLMVIGGGIGSVSHDQQDDISDQAKDIWDQRQYLAKKWLQCESGPNLIMYNACTEMLSHAWYWGAISRYDAQRQLTGKPNGSFLVRNSETNGPQFTLSFRIGNCTLHYRIQHRDSYWHFEARQYESIVEMIEDIMLRSTDEKVICYVKAPCEMQPPFPVILKYPLSRYSKIAHLQDMCRRVIRRHMSHEEIENLPIPVKLQQYLIEEAALFF